VVTRGAIVRGVLRRVLFCVLGASAIPACAGHGGHGAPPPPPPPPVLLAPDPDPAALVPVAWAEALPALRFVNTRTGADVWARLYAADGTVDERAAAAIDAILADRDAAPRPLHRRTLQLVVKAAAHFGATEVDAVSSFRDDARPGSHHRSGDAINWRLRGVTAAKLAAYLRQGARVGVGVYTHPRTQFVHLDLREQSYHWSDASPPGRSWRESRMTDRGAAARDAAYRREQDLPAGR
jgi:uncharacterized protein YcbK (DUF882 family)